MKKGWTKENLKELSTLFADGDWIESKDQSSTGIRLIQTGNVGEGIFKDRLHKSRYISKDTFKRLRCTEIFEGDCLISRLPDPVGRSCVLPDTGEKMITAVDCTIIRFDPSKITPKYFNYYSQSKQYYKDIGKEITGTTRDRISRSKLGEIVIPLPPLPEQKRIVAALDESFAALAKAKENAEKNLENARELFQSFLRDVFDNPKENWEEQNLGKICENLDSKRVPITKKYRVEGRYPYYGASGIVDYVSQFIFDEDLLLVSEDGANLLARTYPIAFSISGKTWVNNHAHVLRFEQKESQRFVEYYLNSIKLDDYVSGMAQPKLNQAMLNSIAIPFPPFSEQKSIVSKFDALSIEIQKLEAIYQQKLSNLEELKKSLLQKAFNGELV